MKSIRRIHKRAKNYTNYEKKQTRDRTTQVNKLRGSKAAINREYNGSVGDIAQEFGVSYHAGKRFLERVLDEPEPNHEQVIRAIKIIQKTLAFELTNKVNGAVPFMDDFIAIIHNDIVVTIRGQDFDEDCIKNLTEFSKIPSKKMKEV